MNRDRHVWQAANYRRSNSRQIRASLDALDLVGLAGGRMADIGCGCGELARAMAERGFVVHASDVSESMVDSTRQLCAGLPVQVELGDANQLVLRGRSFDVVHCGWMLHWLADAEHTLRTMARAAAPGGSVLVLWSCGQPRSDGFQARDLITAVARRPRWRKRLAAAPVALYQHPGDEVCALFEAEGLEISEPPVELPGPAAVGDPVQYRRSLRAAALAAQAEALGEDADEFIDEVIAELQAGGAVNPHNTRIIAHRPSA